MMMAHIHVQTRTNKNYHSVHYYFDYPLFPTTVYFGLWESSVRMSYISPTGMKNTQKPRNKTLAEKDTNI